MAKRWLLSLAAGIALTGVALSDGGWISAARAAAPPPSAAPAGPYSVADLGVFQAVATGMVPADVADGSERRWQRAGRAGFIRYSAPETGGDNKGCQRFVLQQTSPTSLPPATGFVCRFQGMARDDGGANAVIRGPISVAASAGPRGEPRTGDVPPPPPPPPAQPPSPPPPPPPPITQPSPASPGTTSGEGGRGLGSTGAILGGTRGLGSAASGAGAASGGVRRVTTAVLNELMAGEARVARNGGAAVAILSTRTQDASRNLTLCRALFRSIDTATDAEVARGTRTVNGVVQELRPLYWMLARAPAPGADRCAARVAAYDVERGARLRAKLNLTGAGPYLAVLSADDSRAAVIDLGAAPVGETDALVDYFVRGFSQERDIWSPERHTPERSRNALTAFLGRAVTLASLPRLVAASAACIGDSRDVCRPPAR